MRSYLNLESPESWSLDSFGKWCLDKENFNGEKSKIIGYMRKELEVTSDNLFLDQDVRAKAALLLDDLKVNHGQVENVNVSTKHSSESTQPIVIENENLNVDGIQSHADGGLDVDESEKSDITKEWIVDSINVTSKFREYQKQIIESLKKNKKLTWNNAFELLALCSIIILTWPCPYSTFTSSEWIKIIGLNPYKLKQPILPDSLSNFLSHALNDLVLGLDVNFISNDGELGEIAANAFNNFKDKIPVSFDKKISEDEHRYYYLDPVTRPIFCNQYKNYQLRLNRKANDTKKRPDFSCTVDGISILNSELKPFKYTNLQKKKDFVKAGIRAKKSINQLINKKGGPTEKVESYFIDLKYDGLYRAWSFLNTQLVVNQQSLPLLVSTLSHFISIE
ncbi:3084_t:CDS:2, partial [Entrophospora sp. SA101]